MFTIVWEMFYSCQEPVLFWRGWWVGLKLIFTESVMQPFRWDRKTIRFIFTLKRIVHQNIEQVFHHLLTLVSSQACMNHFVLQNINRKCFESQWNQGNMRRNSSVWLLSHCYICRHFNWSIIFHVPILIFTI